MGGAAPSEKVRVGLRAAACAALIIPRDTGLVYVTDTGGRACRAAELEGVFVPIGDRELATGWGLEQALQRYFEGSPHLCVGGAPALDAADADFLDGTFATFNEPLEVDRARLQDSCEAWLHVRVLRLRDFDVYHGFGPAPFAAVLTWTNSY